MSSNGNAGGKASAPPPRRSESAVSFGSPAAGAATDAPVKTPTPSGRASSGGLTPVAGGLIAGAYDTPKGGAASSARKFTPTRTPSGKTPGGKTPSRTPAGTGTKLPPSRRVSSATSTPAAGGSSAANTPAAAAGAGKTPSTAAARHTPKFTPSHDDTTPIASIKRPRASLTGGKERSTSLTMVHAGAGGKQRLGPGPNSVRNLAATTTSTTTTTTTTTRSTSVSLGTGIMTPTGGVTTGTADAEGSASSKSYDSASTSTDSLKENGCHDGGEDGDTLIKTKKAAGTGTSADAGGGNGFASPMPNRTGATLATGAESPAPGGRVATPVNLSSPMAKSAGVDDAAYVAPPTPGLPMSPMHPARPMKTHSPDTHHHNHHAEAGAGDEEREMGPDGQWKISNIFSPVMNFLGGAKEEGGDGVEQQHASDVAIEEEQAGGGGVSADLDAEAAAVEGLVHLNDAIPPQIPDDADDTNDESGYATAEEGIDADGDVAMVDVDGSQTYHVHMHEETNTSTTATYKRNSPNGHDAVVQEYSFDSSVTDVDVDAKISAQNGTEAEDGADIEVDEESQEYEDDDEEEEEEFNPYLFIKSLPTYHLVVPYPQHKICLPPKDKTDPPIALVLDLDETLVHCTVEPISDADMVFPVVFNGVEYSVNVRKRPYLEEFLQRVHGKFEVIVFTASQQVYADELLDRIDPERKYIKHRIFREACLAVEGNYLKDLNVCQRDMKKMVLVDNSPHAFGYQVDNGIPIESWFDDPSDRELLKLERFLRTLHDVADVRELVRQEFGSWKKIRDA